MQQPQFGKSPSGERLKRIMQSANYKDGRFRNRIERPTISEGYSMTGVLYDNLFGKHPRKEPVDSIPSIKQDLHNLPLDSNLLVWFGHSALLLHLEGKKILIDPALSSNASPLPWGVKAYKGSTTYTAADMPEVDYLLITHDHYDHLDYKTALAIKNKVKHVVCGLGVGAHFEHWGYPADQIIELDWNEQLKIDTNLRLNVLRSHHDSGRGFRRAKTLWVAYMFEAAGKKIYISGDGGHDDRFAEAYQKFGAIDWAIMEAGQYDSAWQSVHQLPEEVVKATLQLHAGHMMPVHNSKFTLGNHPWDEPLVKLTALSKDKPYQLTTPMIGEVVWLNKKDQRFSPWWQNVK